jgi:hypothetical protein
MQRVFLVGVIVAGLGLALVLPLSLGSGSGNTAQTTAASFPSTGTPLSPVPKHLFPAYVVCVRSKSPARTCRKGSRTAHMFTLLFSVPAQGEVGMMTMGGTRAGPASYSAVVACQYRHQRLACASAVRMGTLHNGEFEFQKPTGVYFRH